MATLLARRTAVTAADGAGGVVGAVLPVVIDTAGLWLTFTYTPVTTPATVEVRCAVEGSTDGTNWHQLCRFIDQTVVGGTTRICRLPGTVAAAESALTAAAVDTAAVAATVSDGGLPTYLRATTKVQIQTGASASITINVTAG